ncbi:hypothetical protein N9N13_03210 [Opitutales bacterium]|nr:hypothetical protein [Opitutales bacterium]
MKEQSLENQLDKSFGNYFEASKNQVGFASNTCGEILFEITDLFVIA